MIQTGWDIVAVARQPIVDAQYSEIRTEICQSFATSWITG